MTHFIEVPRYHEASVYLPVGSISAFLEITDMDRIEAQGKLHDEELTFIQMFGETSGIASTDPVSVILEKVHRR